MSWAPTFTSTICTETIRFWGVRIVFLGLAGVQIPVPEYPVSHKHPRRWEMHSFQIFPLLLLLLLLIRILTLKSCTHFRHQLLSYKFLKMFNFFESPCIPTFMFCSFCFLCICTPGAINLLSAEALWGSEISHIFWILYVRYFIAESITFNIGYDSDVIRFTFKCSDGWHAWYIFAVGHHFPLVTDVLLKNERRRRIRQELCLSLSFLLF